MSRDFVLFVVNCVLAVSCSAPVTAVNAQEKGISFNRDVRPILADKCFHCHGPDASERQADLRLDHEESAKADRDGSFVVKEGSAGQSELVARILSADPDVVMPPHDSGRSLSAVEKQTLVQWIKDGAAWEGHWSFIAPRRPQLPSVKQHAWPLSAIDHFVLSRIEAAGSKPAPEADRVAWIRRVTFDLTGLPPTLMELDDFLADDSETAYERVVDRLLASERYGEHMAAAWLDAARYADTDGYQNDGPRTMFRWRDWVIDAYNRNMPFDQFTIEQLAGDLIPDATLSQKIATGFNRNHRYNSEAGLVLEEFLLENAVDRVDTTSTVWMGLTMGCARCHDHKYDPFSQREYYQLISFFDNITESGRAIKFGNSEPWVIAPTETQQQQLSLLDRQIHETRQKLMERAAEAGAKIAEFEQRLKNDESGHPDLSDGALVPRGLVKHFTFDDQSTKDVSTAPGISGLAAAADGATIHDLGKFGNVSCQTRSSVSFWLRPDSVAQGVILSRQKKSTTRPGLEILLREGHLQFRIITRWIAGVGAVETEQALTPGEWIHVVMTNDGSQRARGQEIWINGQRQAVRIIHNTNSNTGGTSKDAELRFGGGVHGAKFAGLLDELRFYNSTLFADEIQLLAEPSTVAEILMLPAKDRTPEQTRKLMAWLRANEPAAKEKPAQRKNTLFALHNQYDTLRDRRVKLLDSFPTTMVMEEQGGDRPTPIRVRGEYHNLGEIVSSDTPAVFPKLSAESVPDRLRFARWLVSGQHPLTARVTVNRYWQQYFGIGLVSTPEDFGVQGALPSHPDLLDWLAVEFVESGWNVKALQKLIVLSATYRQDSRFGEAAAGGTQADPRNTLLARGPRQRLTARQLRDQALFVSGLLTAEIGGPSVSPYQPANLWAEMSNMKYRQSKGADLYRRGLYTIWKRTVAPPSLAILDAADRENCVVRPRRTNTPLQALTLLNETTFVESARHLAVRMRRDGGETPIEYAFRVVTSRQPTEVEVAALSEARAEFRLQFLKDPDGARQLLSIGESAASVDSNADPDTVASAAADALLCNVILNLDEALSR